MVLKQEIEGLLYTERTMAGEHFVYIVQCSDGSLYTGYAKNVAQRIALHNAGKGAKYTRARRPVCLQAYWAFEKKGQALRVEQSIKRLTRAQKLHLIAGWKLRKESL
jgi:putative endonuclease